MKILINSLVIVVAAGVGLAVGFGLRAKFGRTSHVVESLAANSALSAATQPKLFGSPKQRSPARANDDSPLATKLERDLSMSSGVTRWLYWLEALEKAAPGDFPRLARLAQGNATAMRFVAARWVEVDPRHMFDTLVAASKSGSSFPTEELATVLLEEWPKRDPEAVIAALNTTNTFGSRGTWRMHVAGVLFEKDVERGLRVFSEWHIENFGPREGAAAKWAAANPRHAAEFALANPAGYASRLTMETIGEEWAKNDPARALEFAVANPGELGASLGAAALKEWAGRNLKEAADWLTTADARTRNRLSATFVETWAKQDSASALTWCEQNLSGSALAQAVGGVVRGAAEKDLAGAAALVLSLNPSPARSEAAAGIARKMFPELSSAKTVGPDAVAWLTKLDGPSMKRVLDEVTWGWSTSDPKSMASFLAASSSERVPAYSYSVVARELARRNPSDALEWAGRLPAERAISAGSDAFGEWRNSQPEAAMKWLSSLPPNDPRRQPFYEGAIRSLAYHPQAADQLAVMTTSERATARTVIETMPLAEDRRRDCWRC
jgi:hypothetical protein